MFRILLKNVSLPKQIGYQSVARFSNALSAVERLKVNPSNVNAAQAQIPQEKTPNDPATGTSDFIPLLDSMSTEIARDSLGVVSPKEAEPAVKVVQPFEEIPGPTILKLWEKYWKYVPLFSTQLFCSLLINKFTEGRLTWNKNFNPIKYFFNEYGPIVRINGPLLGDVVMIHRPEHVAQVFKDEGNAPVRSGIDVLQHYRQDYKKYRFSGPYSMRGNEWMEIKANLQVPFSRQLNNSLEKVDSACDTLIERIQKIRNNQDEVPRNFHEELTRWGMECFSLLMFNKSFGFLDVTDLYSRSEAARFLDALNAAHTYMSRCESGFQVWRFVETPNSRRLFAACDTIDTMIAKHIHQAQNEMRNQLLQSEGGLFTSKDTNSVLEQLLISMSMKVEDVSTIMMDMIILGVQATVNTQAFLMYYLARNLRAQQKLYKEITTVMLNEHSCLDKDMMKEMPYFNACLKECLRLRPAFPYLTRMLQKDLTLHGYKVPKGTYIIVANQIASMREENFEDPEKFRPERWLQDKRGNEEIHEFSFLPFGKGLRSCFGKEMAETQIMMLTAKLVRNFRIEYDYADIESNLLMVNVPNKPLRFRFIDRQWLISHNDY